MINSFAKALVLSNELVFFSSTKIDISINTMNSKKLVIIVLERILIKLVANSARVASRLSRSQNSALEYQA
jgi:hypothetical protein